MLLVIATFSLSETQKIVLNIRNFSICTGTTAVGPLKHGVMLTRPVFAGTERTHTAKMKHDSSGLPELGRFLVVQSGTSDRDAGTSHS